MGAELAVRVATCRGTGVRCRREVVNQTDEFALAVILFDD
jgi:hypothetical protein